jgi:hypothetical protein
MHTLSAPHMNDNVQTDHYSVIKHVPWVGLQVCIMNAAEAAVLLPLQVSDMRTAHFSSSPLRELELFAERDEDEAVALAALWQLPTT